MARAAVTSEGFWTPDSLPTPSYDVWSIRYEIKLIPRK